MSYVTLNYMYTHVNKFRVGMDSWKWGTPERRHPVDVGMVVWLFDREVLLAHILLSKFGRCVLTADSTERAIFR